MKTNAHLYGHRTCFESFGLGIKAIMAMLLALPLGCLAAVTQISTCPYTITAPGTYHVAQDLKCSGTAITISANDVDLHLGGHTISGDGTGNGIEVGGGADVKIHHGTVQGFSSGIFLNGTLNNDLNHLTLVQNKDIGILGIGAMGTAVTENTCNRNGSGGIAFGANVSANSFTRNTANLNGAAGITIFGPASANLVTDNIANQNGDAGINIFSDASGNTVSRNTADQNGAVGIQIVGQGNQGNLIQQNTCRTNGGEGIRLFNYDPVGPAQNMIRENACVGNNIGLRLFWGASQNTLLSNSLDANNFGILLDDNTTANNLLSNSVRLSLVGIWLQTSATGNLIRNNNVQTCSWSDVEDDDPGCVNSWLSNTFQTSGGSGANCIH